MFTQVNTQPIKTSKSKGFEKRSWECLRHCTDDTAWSYTARAATRTSAAAPWQGLCHQDCHTV